MWNTALIEWATTSSQESVPISFAGVVSMHAGRRGDMHYAATLSVEEREYSCKRRTYPDFYAFTKPVRKDERTAAKVCLASNFI